MIRKRAGLWAICRKIIAFLLTLQAQECSIEAEATSSPKEIYMIISVYNVLTEPGVALFMDPWKMYAAGSLSLVASSTYHASIQDSSSAIFLHDAIAHPLLDVVMRYLREVFRIFLVTGSRGNLGHGFDPNDSFDG